MCGSNIVNTSRAGIIVNNIVRAQGNGGSGNCALGINHGTERSEWILSKLYIWNYHLSASDFAFVASELHNNFYLIRQFYETHANNVLQTLNPYLAVYHKPPAIATPGTRGQTEARVRSAVSIITKPHWGLLLALLVRQNLSLQLVVSYTPRVSVSLGTLTAQNVSLASTNHTMGQLCALLVELETIQIRCLQPHTA